LKPLPTSIVIRLEPPLKSFKFSAAKCGVGMICYGTHRL
jgi:hypothetical protein